MFRPLAALAILASGLTTALAAPIIKGRAPVYYHPTREGDKRVYEVRTGESVHETTEVVTQVDKKDGGLLVSMAREGTAGVSIGTMEVSSKGLTRVAPGGKALPMAFPLLKLPAKPGDTWTVESTVPVGAADRKTVYTVGHEEEIEVPAGKFKAIRVDAVSEIGERSARVTTWYAPGVGQVKIVTQLGATERTQLLKSFTPGK